MPLTRQLFSSGLEFVKMQKNCQNATFQLKRKEGRKKAQMHNVLSDIPTEST